MQSLNIHLNKLFYTSRWERFLWFFRKKRYHIALPESWDQVPPELVPDITKIIMTRKDEQEGNVRLFRLLSGLKPLIFFNIEALDIVEKIGPQLRWIYTTPLTNAQLQSFIRKKEVFTMPGPEFSDYTFDQYRATDDAYEALTESVSDDHIDKLIALIYGKSPGQCHTLPDQYKYFALYWFMSCKEQLYTKYLKPLEDEKEKKQDQTPANWEDIKTDIAENGCFGAYREVGRTNVNIIYQWLAKNRKRQMAMEANSLKDQILNNHQNILNR